MGSLSGLRPFHRQLASPRCAAQWGAFYCGASVFGVDVSLWAHRAAAVFDCCGGCFRRESLARSSCGCDLTVRRKATMLRSIGMTKGRVVTFRKGGDLDGRG